MSGRLPLRQQVLLAVLECSGGKLDKIFTAEELLLAAWVRDKVEWGLRGHEQEHPDSEKIYKELDRVSVKGKNVRGGLVGLGLLERIRQRTYRLWNNCVLAFSNVTVMKGVSHASATRERRLTSSTARSST